MHSLPRVQRPDRRELEESQWPVAVWWLGCERKVGETTLEELFAGSCAADHQWPLMPAGCGPARVVLVARSTAAGVIAAQRALRDFASGQLPVSLLGLVVVADSPRPVPRQLRDRVELMAAALPGEQVWWLPWVKAWAAGEPPTRSNAPHEAGLLLAELQRLTDGAEISEANLVE
jgi:hypothetical protein